MDKVNLEVHNYILLDKCKCCLGDDQLKNMWGEYYEDGKKEIYGEMLNECFDLTNIIQYDIEKVCSVKCTEQICESCICRLRDGLEFKQKVLASALILYQHLNGSTEVKQEDKVECLEGNECVQDISSISDRVSGCSQEQEYEDVEYLESDEADNTEVTPNSLPISPNQNTKANSEAEIANITEAEFTYTCEADFTYMSEAEVTDRTVEPNRKFPKRRKKNERLKTYKQYLREDLLKAVAKVKGGLLSIADAAKEFKVPRKTLAYNLYLTEQTKDVDIEAQMKTKKNEQHYQLINEIKKILTYTNAVPFKTKAARYYCTYCSTDGPHFDDPNDLRAHTRTEHVDHRTRNLEIALRPQHQNEVLKIDIDSLHCTVCCTIIPTWSDMFRHLEEAHNIELDEAYTKVIPYILKRDLKCVLCNDSFPNYHHLDSHMNSHYSNYICSECGGIFLSASRLTKHLKIHKTGRFPCAECGKLFYQDKYRQKHFDHVHKQQKDIKCLYCPATFYGAYQRHLHLAEKHKEKISSTTCELCGMAFEWRRYYVTHMRRKHNIRTLK